MFTKTNSTNSCSSLVQDPMIDNVEEAFLKFFSYCIRNDNFEVFFIKFSQDILEVKEHQFSPPMGTPHSLESD